MERLFVYGTLKRGERNHTLVLPWLLGVEEAWVEGFRLYRLPLGERPYPYPGMVPGEGRVWGEVLLLLPGALPLVDHLEDEGEEYRRVRVRVETEGGPVEAWTYLYLGSLEGAEPIPEGVWP